MAKVKRPRKERFDLDNVEPIRLTSKPKDDDSADEIDMVHAFSIDDRDFYVPTVVPFKHSVEAMEIFAQRGEAAAVAYTLRTVLGDDAYDALRAFPDLDEESFNGIVTLANQIVNAGSGKAQ